MENLNITAWDLSFIKNFEAYQPIFHSKKSNKKEKKFSLLVGNLGKQIFCSSLPFSHVLVNFSLLGLEDQQFKLGEKFSLGIKR